VGCTIGAGGTVPGKRKPVIRDDDDDDDDDDDMLVFIKRLISLHNTE